MKRLYGVVLGFILGMGPMAPVRAYDVEEPLLTWVAECKGDKEKAQVVTWDADMTGVKDYCLILNGLAFDPLNIDKSKPHPGFPFPTAAKNLILMVELPQEEKSQDYVIEMTVDQGLPVCTTCDETCQEEKKRSDITQKQTLPSSITGKKNYFLNVSDFVKDWKLTDIAVEATLKLNGEEVSGLEFSDGGWPWCAK